MLDGIELRHKSVPTCDLNPGDRDFPLVVKRKSNVDLTTIQEELAKAGAAIWDPCNQKGNVPIHRAGHDQWGIGKIVLIYCDDYLKRVYTFPWFGQWKHVLEPIFDSLNIKSERVVRCLFASIPAGAKIPTHHDTGFWVEKSHRIHVPIITNSNVEFMAGMTEEDMSRFEFTCGNIYELNNRCKHQVSNNGLKERVHLIFDYVEASYPLEHIVLSPGMIINQTRRTIDLASDYGSRPVPSFIIIGAQKAGTTALYDYIVQHPLVVPARRKETHYFDWRWQCDLPSISTAEGKQLHMAEYRKYFFTKELLENPSLITGEATPSYMLGGSTVLERLKAIAPEVRIVAILRDPVDRAYSQYNMTADPNGTAAQLESRGHHHLNGRSFEEIVDSEIEELGTYLSEESTLLDANFDKDYLASRSKFTHGGHSFLGRGLYAKQLEMWFQAFPREQILVLSLDQMKTTMGLEHMMERTFNFLGLPSHRIVDSSPKNTRDYAPMEPSIRTKLESFFAPQNEKLFKLINEDFGWNRRI